MFGKRGTFSCSSFVLYFQKYFLYEQHQVQEKEWFQIHSRPSKEESGDEVKFRQNLIIYTTASPHNRLSSVLTYMYIYNIQSKVMNSICGHLDGTLFQFGHFLKNAPKVLIPSYHRVNDLALIFRMVTLDGYRKFIMV